MSLAEDARLRRLRRSERRARRRLRYRVALVRLAYGLPLPLGLACAALAAIKALHLTGETQRWLVVGVVASALAAVAFVLHGALKRIPRWAGALALDEHHQLNDRVTTALELVDSPPDEQSPFAQAAIEDGLTTADRLDPRRAVPIPIPRELGISAVLMGLLVGVGWLEVRVERALPPPPSFQPLAMAPDDLALFHDIGQQLAEQSQDPESLAAIRRFNALIEDIADRRLDRREAFKRLGELEAELARMADADREARELGLEGMAKELARSGLTKEAAEALEQKRLADAEKALRELAERLRRKTQKPSAAELQRLRSALERASRVNTERLQAIEERRRSLEQERKSLLNKHKNAKDPKVAERDPKVQENRRKLERLERDKERASRASKELSALDRELAEAAEALMKDMGKSAEDLEQGAQDLNRMAKRAMSDQEKRELLERMKELREVLRQQGQAGADRQRQMMRFGQRARGGKGQGQPQSGQEKGKQGGKPGGQPGQAMGTAEIEIPRISRAPGSGPGQPSSGNDGASSGSAQGPEPGKGHDPNLQGEKTPTIGQTQDVTAAAVDTGQGTASAEVIHGAAEGGFVGKGYRDVYVQYEAVAEQALEHDKIPPGYRFYVRRYFQLIRPRE